MSKTRLGYVQLPASEVVERAEAAIDRIADKRIKSQENFIANMMAPKKGWFFGHPARSREAALKAIKDDQYMAEEWWYITKYVGPTEESLNKLVKVGNGLLEGGNPTMEVSIEIATSLFPSNNEQS